MARLMLESGVQHPDETEEQVGVAYRLFAFDHRGRFPFAVSTNEGGSLELGGDAWHQFQTLSNDWTRELHPVSLKNLTYGNLLFSDGHAERFTSPELIQRFSGTSPSPPAS